MPDLFSAPDEPEQADHAELAAALALALAPGIGPARWRALVGRHGSARAALDAGRSAWREAGLPEAAQAALASPDAAAIERELTWAGRPGNRLLLPGSPAYPPLLALAPRPPVLLWVIGEPALLADPQLAVVGARRPSAGGRDIARSFAAQLAASGLVITSGLALGIDAAAHRGALEAGGRTLAVLGTGLDRIYPAANRDLAHAIVDGRGALVSEFPLGTPALADNFPRRNRVIAGLSLGTLVVEAALASGSLITARLAAEHNREVFAVPGSIHNPLARGCHALIREGAKLVESAQDILAELAPRLQALLSAPPAAPAQVSGTALPAGGAAPAALDEDYRKLLDLLADSPAPVDLLVRRSGLTAEIVSSMLLILELEGYVATAPGGLYSRLV